MNRIEKMFLCFLLYGICMEIFKHIENPYVEAVCLILSFVATQIINWRNNEKGNQVQR